MNITPIADVRIIGTLSPYTVEAAHHELDLRDGSLHRLHHVRRGGLRCKTLRALQLDDKRTYSVFDLTALAHQLRADLPGTADRDVPGLIKFTLRGQHPNGLAMRRAISEVVEVCGVPQLIEARAAA